MTLPQFLRGSVPLVLMLIVAFLFLRWVESIPSTADNRAFARSSITSSSDSHSAAIPQTLRIPNVGISASIEQVGITASGAMDVPKTWEDVGWYSRGPRPGDVGAAVIDGHLDSYTGPAVFWNLRNLHVGDIVAVEGESGATIRFAVTRMQTFLDSDSSAAAAVFHQPASAIRPSLNLITCTGSWDEKNHQYASRLIVFSSRIDDVGR